MKILGRSIAVFIAASMVSGCGKQVGKQEDAAPLQTVFAVVDNEPITATDVKNAVIISTKVHELETKKKSPKFGRWSNAYAMKLTPHLVNAIAWEKDLDRKGVVRTPESDAVTLATYNRRMRRKAKSVDELATSFGDLAPVFVRQFERESKFNAVYLQHGELTVDEQDVSRFYMALSNRVKRCQMINVRAMKKINQAWDELKSGREWTSIATNYTEDAMLERSYADNWKEWISIELSKMGSPELAATVAKLKVGEYTKPIQHEEGIIIVKLLARDEDFCSLARILVRSAADVEIPCREDAVAKLSKDRRRKFQGECLDEVKKHVKIEYPQGKKFTFKLWKEEKLDPKSAAMGL